MSDLAFRNWIEDEIDRQSGGNKMNDTSHLSSGEDSMFSDIEISPQNIPEHLEHLPDRIAILVLNIEKAILGMKANRALSKVSETIHQFPYSYNQELTRIFCGLDTNKFILQSHEQGVGDTYYVLVYNEHDKSISVDILGDIVDFNNICLKPEEEDDHKCCDVGSEVLNITITEALQGFIIDEVTRQVSAAMQGF